MTETPAPKSPAPASASTAPASGAPWAQTGASAGARPSADTGGAKEFLDRDPTASEEEEFFASPEDREWMRLANRKLELENEQFQRDMSNREQFAERAYGLTQTWIGFLIVVTLAQFITAKLMKVGLSEKEFIVVVTTTTASLFGFWLLVGQYLFHRGPNQSSSTGNQLKNRAKKGSRRASRKTPRK